MDTIDALLQTFPEHSKDIATNVRRVLTDSKLPQPRLWGVAIASAVATREPALIAAIQREAFAAGVSEDVIDDARAAASVMALNNVYFRFRHFMADEEIDKIPPRLQMQRAARPRGEKIDFELFCLAVSAINGCELCVRAHARVVTAAGMSKEELAECVRVAATLHAAAVATSQAGDAGLG